MKERLLEIIKWYETLSPETLKNINLYYHEDTFFKDPFHQFNGLNKLVKIYEKMFKNLPDSRFIITSHLFDEAQAFMTWEMTFRAFGKPQVIRGSTFFKFEGTRINFHRDYWDTSEELYVKIPVLGLFFKLIKKLF